MHLIINCIVFASPNPRQNTTNELVEIQTLKLYSGKSVWEHCVGSIFFFHIRDMLLWHTRGLQWVTIKGIMFLAA